jgi:hypothetical protein
MSSYTAPVGLRLQERTSCIVTLQLQAFTSRTGSLLRLTAIERFFHLKEQAEIAQLIKKTPGPDGKVVLSEVPALYPAVAPAVGRTDWIIPTDMELETTKDKNLSAQLEALVADPTCFLTGLPFVRPPDPIRDTEILRDLLATHSYDLARIHAGQKIVVIAFST